MTNTKLIAKNKKAYFEYSIIDKIEAGISLTGTEVKSARDGKVDLKGGFVHIVNGEALLEGVNIQKYTMGTYANHEPLRTRKLLLHKKQIRKLSQEIKEKGFTIVPLSIYFSNGKIKVEIGLVKGKKLWDKRESLKEKDAKRKTEQVLSEKY